MQHLCRELKFSSKNLYAYLWNKIHEGRAQIIQNI